MEYDIDPLANVYGPTDYKLANIWITWIVQQLLEDRCILVESIEPTVREYVVSRLASMRSVEIGDIGDGRYCVVRRFSSFE